MTALAPGTTVHIVGVGGAGMSGVARLLAEMGCVVSGSDAHEFAVLADLRNAGVHVDLGHDRANGASSQVVLWSPAVAMDNVELVAARERHATLISRAEVFEQLALLQPVIGLTGTHGKTTTTSMMVRILARADRDDSRLLGAPVSGVGANGHWGSGSLIMEVDESYGTFGLLAPYALGLLNIEADHLDHYGTIDVLEAAFRELVERTSGPVVAWWDDPGVVRVLEQASRGVVCVGTTDQAQWRVENVVLARRGASFTLNGPEFAIDLALGVTGAHNVANASVATVLALSLGVAPKAIIEGLAEFHGAPRRFEYLGAWRGVDVYEDYAHLPGEITATLAATRAAGYERITAVFQPHRVTRTLNLAPEFGSAFAGATSVIVTDIFTAGEANPTHVTGELISTAIQHGSRRVVTYYDATFDEVARRLESLHDLSDVIVVLGAGDIGAVAHQLSGGFV